MASKERTYLRDGRAPIPTNLVTSKIMSANKGRNTKPELILRKALWNSGLKGYRLNWKNVPGKPDIAFPGKRIAVFVNGCFWHRCEKCYPHHPKTNIEFWNTKFNKNKERDIRKTNQLIAIGWKVLTIWECEIKADLLGSVEKVKNKFLE